MRIGNRLGGTVFWAFLATMTVAPCAAVSAAERVQPVPLGGTLGDLSGDRQFGVYVPTRFGGELTVKSSTGTVGAITGPDGRVRPNGQDAGPVQNGWYTFKVSGASKPYSIETSFVQVGQSARKPWNFYYWPTKADSIHEPWAGGNGRVDSSRNPNSDDIQVKSVGSYIAPGEDIIMAGPNGILESSVSPGDDSTWFPNQYDDMTFRGADGTMYQTPSPMLKYDQIFSSSARNWEAANSQNQDISRWPGHCLGGAVASILLNEPNPAPGSGMSKDELKALWAELGENHLNHRIGDFANDIPAGPPRPGFDECDRFVPRFHTMLETHIRGEKKALLGNLRAFPPRGTTGEVWNHGLGKYTAVFHAMPGKGDRAVRIELTLEANSGSSLNGQDDKPRVIKYEYSLVYGLNGQVDETNAYTSDWISVGGEAMYCPLNVLEVVESRWAGHNPMVTESNVRSIDLANGGGFNRRVGATAPTFKPVGSYEAGRGPLFAGNNNSNSNSNNPDGSPRRGGLFRGMFGFGR